MMRYARSVLYILTCWRFGLAFGEENAATTTKPALNFLGKGKQVGDMGAAVDKLEKHIHKIAKSFAARRNGTQNLDVNRTGVCAAEIKRYCAEVEFGFQRIAHCLNAAAKAAREKKEGKILSLECSESLGSALMVMSHMHANHSMISGPIPVDIVPGLRAACNPIVAKMCNQPVPGLISAKTRGYTACLQSLNYQGKLTPQCSKKMIEVQGMFSKNMMMDPQFFKACGPRMREIKECKELPWTPFTGHGEKMACLKRHVSELDADCKKEIDRVEVMQSQDVRLNPTVIPSCRKELTLYCKHLEFGEARMMKCLWENINKEGFGAACRRSVALATKISLSNYTKDYRLRTRCRASINNLCAEAKTLVKGSSDKEYEGVVIQCLKRNFTKIDNPDCKQEVRRVVKIHAVNPEMNPQWLKKCQEDKKTFCANAEYVHLCLRKNIEKISPGCKRVELLQGSLQARGIRLKPFMKTKCQTAITQFCKDVPEVEGQVVKCLRKNYNEKDFPIQCAKIVKDDLEASQHDLRLKFGVAEECQSDAEEFCPDAIHSGGPALIQCLVSNINKMRLKPSCESGIRSVAKGGIENIKADAVTARACVDDVAFFCSNVIPGQGNIHKCLLDHKMDLGTECAAAEFRVQKLVASDATLSPMVMKACKPSIDEHCKNVKATSLWGCLEDLHKRPAGLPETCRKQVVYHIRTKNSELHLNPMLYKMCQTDFETLCEEEMFAANDKAFSSNGAAINCLIEKRAKVRDENCKRSMVKSMRERIDDIKANPQAHGICIADIDRFCKDAPKGPGHIRKCLVAHMKQLEELCQDVMGEVMKLQSEDIRLQPSVEKNCAREVKRFCEDVPKGTGKVRACLLKQLHHADMQQECKKELEKTMVTQSKNILLNPALLRACKGQYEKLRDRKMCASLGLGYKVEDISKLNPAEIMRKPELQGHIRQCLLDHRHNITDSNCKSAITSQLALQSNDFRANSIATAACANDLKALCNELKPGRGRWLSCLSNQTEKIKNAKCKEMVKDMRKAEREDVRINPEVNRNCKLEVRSFCQGVEPGQGRVIKCLWGFANETGFANECRLALVKINVQQIWKASDSTRFQDLMKWLELNHNSSRGMMTGAIAGCVVALSLLSAMFMSLKRGASAKLGYAVKA